MSAATRDEDVPESGFQSTMARVFSASPSVQVPFYVGFAGLIVLVLAWGDTLSLSIDLFLHPAETACAPAKSPEVCASEHYQQAIDQFMNLAFLAAVGVSLYAYLARFLPNRERAVRGDSRRWGRLLVSLSGFVFFSQCAQLTSQAMWGSDLAAPLSESASPGAQWWQAARMAIAGAAEEPFFVGLPIGPSGSPHSDRHRDWNIRSGTGNSAPIPRNPICRCRLRLGIGRRRSVLALPFPFRSRCGTCDLQRIRSG